MCSDLALSLHSGVPPDQVPLVWHSLLAAPSMVWPRSQVYTAWSWHHTTETDLSLDNMSALTWKCLPEMWTWPLSGSGSSGHSFSGLKYKSHNISPDLITLWPCDPPDAGHPTQTVTQTQLPPVLAAVGGVTLGHALQALRLGRLLVPDKNDWG